MIAIRSNKALKYNPIKPNETGIIELRITEIRELMDNQTTILTINDYLIGESDVLLNTRYKQFSFSELDQLELLLADSAGTYMEKRIQQFKDGLLFITRNDAHPVYFSAAEDWEVV